MKACAVIRLFIIKLCFQQPKRVKNSEYGLLEAVGILIFARFKSLANHTHIAEHLKKHPKDLNRLGLSSIPY